MAPGRRWTAQCDSLLPLCGWAQRSDSVVLPETYHWAACGLAESARTPERPYNSLNRSRRRKGWRCLRFCSPTYVSLRRTADYPDYADQLGRGFAAREAGLIPSLVGKGTPWSTRRLRGNWPGVERIEDGAGAEAGGAMKRANTPGSSPHDRTPEGCRNERPFLRFSTVDGIIYRGAHRSGVGVASDSRIVRAFRARVGTATRRGGSFCSLFAPHQSGVKPPQAKA
jgi:hypothetical protein